MTDYALRITETVGRLQKELKCGICCSTFKDPILSTCHHVFCRSCINACFERKRKVQCPICRSILEKRSCRDTYQITMAVQNYLKLSEAFKKDIANQTTFKALPPEKMFMESQIPLDVTIIPENDGKRCAPDFAIPLLPVRRKRISRQNTVPPMVSEEPEPQQAPPTFQQAPPTSQQAPPPPKKETKNVECLTDPYKMFSEELKNVDISEHINTIRENSDDLDEVDALFRLIPSIRPFLEKNIYSLMSKLAIEKPEKRVSFAAAPERILEKENVEKIPENEVEAEVENPIVADDDDECVEDSEGEVAKEEDAPDTTQSTTLDADRTARAIQDDEARIDEELSHVPKSIVCSRIHNDEDEELLSDFYTKFLSNACRFSEEVNSRTTHLVMMNSEDRMIPQKSTAYLQAVARKCIVVGRQWLVDCLKTGLLLSEEDYTITSCSSDPDPNALEIGWLRSRNDEKGKLFAGCRFMILRKFTMNPYFDYKQLIDLVQLCGGEILSCYQNLSPTKLYIIFSTHSQAIGEAQNMENLYKCDVVTMEWVLDSISEYSILPTQKYKAVDSKESQD